MKIIKIHVNKRSIPIGVNRIVSKRKSRRGYGTFARRKSMKCPECGTRMVKNYYKHCWSCGQVDWRKKCSKCGGKMVSETYYNCPSCGRTN